MSVGVSGLSPRVGLPLEVDAWPGDQLAHELIAKIQAHLLTSSDNPSFAAPVAFTPQLDVSVFCLHTLGNGSIRRRAVEGSVNCCGNGVEMLWNVK